jgi:glycosyltransferase involved in cell wall biosynthesis
VKHGENGLLFSRGNARELARMIKEAVTDRSTRRRLGTAARKTVVTRFEKDTVYREIVGILFG